MGHIVQPSVQQTLTIGGHTFTDLRNLIRIGINCAAAGAIRYSTFRLSTSNGTSGYQVTAGKTLKIRAASVIQTSGVGASSFIYIGYGDNDVGISSAAAPTNAAYMGGNANPGLVIGPNISPSAQNPRLDTALTLDVPAAKYPFTAWETTYSGVIYLFGYEE